MVNKESYGTCPYCQSTNLVELTGQSHPRKKVSQCSNCNGYSCGVEIADKQYPLMDRDNPESTPTLVVR